MPAFSIGNFNTQKRKQMIQNVVFNIIKANRDKHSRPSLAKAIEIFKTKGFDKSLIEKYVRMVYKKPTL